MSQKINYTYCPQCRGPLEPLDAHHHCPACNITIYENVAASVAALIIRDGRLLMCRRASEPFKGVYNMIGGFMEPGETAEQTAIREAKEETGLDIQITGFFGVYHGQYGDGVHTVDIKYVAEIIGGQEHAGDDADSLEWVDLKNIPPEALSDGFKDVQDCLRDLQKKYRA